MKKMIPRFPCRMAISFSFAYFSFFSKKKPDEKDDFMLSLPNGNLFFLLPTFLFQQKESNEKDDSILSLPSGNLFFLLPTFLFQQKEK